jgi:hypothetical protein
MRTIAGAAVAALSLVCAAAGCAAAAPPPVQAPMAVDIPPLSAPPPVVETPPPVVRARGYRLSYSIPPAWSQEVGRDRVTLRAPADTEARIVLRIVATLGPSSAYEEVETMRREFEENGWTVASSQSWGANFGRQTQETDIVFSRLGADASTGRVARLTFLQDGAAPKTALLITGEWPDALDEMFSAEHDEQRRSARLVPEHRADGAARP